MSIDDFIDDDIPLEEESTKGVSASIMCGKIARIGTGVCELMVDTKKLPASIITDIQEKTERKIQYPKDTNKPGWKPTRQKVEEISKVKQFKNVEVIANDDDEEMEFY